MHITIAIKRYVISLQLNSFLYISGCDYGHVRRGRDCSRSHGHDDDAHDRGRVRTRTPRHDRDDDAHDRGPVRSRTPRHGRGHDVHDRGHVRSRTPRHDRDDDVYAPLLLTGLLP